MDQTTEQLTNIIREKYNALDEAGTIEILPAWLAEQVYREIDPGWLSPALVQVAAVLELRQLARAVCRQRHDDGERTIEQQQSLFDYRLQDRYPAPRVIEGISENAYILRSHLTFDERMLNVHRLRKEAKAKTLHADALQAETDLLTRDRHNRAQDADEGTGKAER